MPETKYGVENIKKVIGWVLGIADDVPKAMADGKLTLKDFPLFVDDAVKVPSVIAALGKLQHEIQNMDPAERADIDEFVRAKIGNPNANVANVIAISIKTVVDSSLVAQDIIELVEAIKALKA
jgi:hypothetical protein